jgi:hypothetical protein
MSPDLQYDLELMRPRAYGTAEWVLPVLERYHKSKERFTKEVRPSLEKAHDWLLVPLTLWPFSMTDLLNACLDAFEQASRLSDTQRLVIDLIPDPPNESTCSIAAEHELRIQSGSYDGFVKTDAKFDQVEADLKSDPAFQKQWKAINLAFNVPAKADYKGVIRRTMMTERNLRPDWSVSFNDENASFSAAFDAFCLRWNLYGMQHDEPLLLKLAVHLTPYGTMMHIPAYWSLDKQRDINWPDIAALHRARAKNRQGPAIAANQAARREQAIKLRQLDAAAAQLKLRGAKKHTFLCHALGWVPETDPKRLQRLRKLVP